MKKTVGIYEAKASLSKLIRAVKTHGVSFQISERGKPVALLTPLIGASSLQDRMDELTSAGILELPEQPGRPNSIDKVKGSLSRFLEERE